MLDKKKTNTSEGKMDANSKIYIYCIAENEKASHFLNQGYFVACKQLRVIELLRKHVKSLISSEGSISINSNENEKTQKI